MESSELDRGGNTFVSTGIAILFDQIAHRLAKDDDRNVSPPAHLHDRVGGSRGAVTIENDNIGVVFVHQLEEMGLDIGSIPCCREFPRRSRDR